MGSGTAKQGMTVGIIGGGQLAWMMAPGAKNLGINLVVQTPSLSDPAVAIAQDTVLGAIADATVTQTLAQRCDVITFENEFVDHPALQVLANQGISFLPTLKSLEPLLDKYTQRSYLKKTGLPTPQFLAISADTNESILCSLGFPVVLKARRQGYDGKGTFILPDLSALITVLRDSQHQDTPPEWLLEAFVPFEKELAVMAARSHTGEIVVYPVVETQQEQQVCRRVFVTGELSDAVCEQVKAIAQQLLNSLNFVGIMGIEFFLTPDGQVLVNETAPRTHNSGHYSLEACHTSQFEQQLRAVTGQPLADPSLKVPGAVMVNLLGYESTESDYADVRQSLSAIPQATLYWYGKSVSRPGRKLGHVTVVLQATTPEARRQEAIALNQTIESLWYRS